MQNAETLPPSAFGVRDVTLLLKLPVLGQGVTDNILDELSSSFRSVPVACIRLPFLAARRFTVCACVTHFPLAVSDSMKVLHSSVLIPDHRS